MTFICRACGTPFKSLLIPQEKALVEVTNKLATHISRSHPDLMQSYVVELQGLCKRLDFILSHQRLIQIPPTETYTIGYLTTQEDLLLGALGVDTKEIDPSEPLEEPPITPIPPAIQAS